MPIRDSDANQVDLDSEKKQHDAARVIVVAADRALLGLLREWLTAGEYEVMQEKAAGAAGRYDLVIVDIPFPRHGGPQLIARVTGEYPGVPILALSSCFFGDVECQGQVARSVGVQSVLPKPVTRDRLVRAVETLIKRDPKTRDAADCA
jgi:DNA-binding response OmpR family regulator